MGLADGDRDAQGHGHRPALHHFPAVDIAEQGGKPGRATGRRPPVEHLRADVPDVG
ncbi:hypothetical protein [Nonomuraea sp. NPDC003754]